MKRLSASIAAIVLFSLMMCAVAEASYVIVTVTKGNKLENELGYTLELTPNSDRSDLAGTLTFSLKAPKTPRLENLARVFLMLHEGKRLVGSIPLELQKGSASEQTGYFQLAPQAAKQATLDLWCPVPNMPNGVVYRIELSTYVPNE